MLMRCLFIPILAFKSTFCYFLFASVSITPFTTAYFTGISWSQTLDLIFASVFTKLFIKFIECLDFLARLFNTNDIQLFDVKESLSGGLKLNIKAFERLSALYHNPLSRFSVLRCLATHLTTNFHQSLAQSFSTAITSVLDFNH